MNSESVEGRRTLAWLLVAAAGVRAAFGIIMSGSFALTAHAFCSKFFSQD
jgi:hypothetical protein